MANDRRLFALSTERKDKVAVANQPSLLDVPSGVLNDIGSFLNFQDKTRIVKICKTTYNFFQPDIDKAALKKLLHHVAFGEKVEVEKMLKNQPELLYKKDITQDPSGRTIEGTAYQIALGAKDVSLGKDREMVEMIARYLKKRPNGKEELAKQFAEQFPEGFEKQETERAAKNSAALKKVFAEIEKANSHKECEDAIEEFKNHLKPQGVIKTGYHFNDKLLTEAYQLFNRHHRSFENLPMLGKARLTAINIIGTIQFYLPACYAQAFCDGIYNVTGNKKPLSRRLNLEDHRVTLKQKEFVPFYSPSLGNFHFVYSYYAWPGKAVDLSPGPFWFDPQFILIKDLKLKAIKANLNSKKRQCVMM